MQVKSFVYFRCGDITLLNVEAIVNSTNEKFVSSAKSPEAETIYEKAGPELLADIKKNIRGIYF